MASSPRFATPHDHDATPLTMLLPNLPPRRFLAFAGAVLEWQGGTAWDIGISAGLTEPRHRRRSADLLAEAGFVRRDGAAPEPGGEVLAYPGDRDRLWPTDALSSLDAFMAADDLDRVDGLLDRLPFYAAVKRLVASGHGPAAIQSAAVAEAFGPGAPAREVTEAFGYPAAFGRAWVRDGRLLDGGAVMPDDLPAVFGAVFDGLQAGGMASVAAMLDGLCARTGVGPERMHRVLGTLGSGRHFRRWEFLTRFGDRVPRRPPTVEVLSGCLCDLGTRAVPLDRMAFGDAVALTVRARPSRKAAPATPSVRGRPAARPAVPADPWLARWKGRTPVEPVPLDRLAAAVAGMAAGGTVDTAAPGVRDGEAEAWDLVNMGLATSRDGVVAANRRLASLARALSPGRSAEATAILRRCLPELDSVLHGLATLGSVRPARPGDMEALSMAAFGQARSTGVALACLRHAALVGAAWTDGPHVRHGEGTGDPGAAFLAAFRLTSLGGAAPIRRFLPAFCAEAGLSPLRAAEWLRKASREGCMPGHRLVTERHARAPEDDASRGGQDAAPAYAVLPAWRMTLGSRAVSAVAATYDGVDAGLSIQVSVEADARRPDGATARVAIMSDGLAIEASPAFDPDDDGQAELHLRAMRARLRLVGKVPFTNAA